MAWIRREKKTIRRTIRMTKKAFTNLSTVLVNKKRKKGSLKLGKKIIWCYVVRTVLK